MAGEHTDLNSSDAQVPAEELAFRWRGGRLSMNFAATVGERWQRCIERLRTPADLSRWFRDAGMAEATVPVGPQDLVQARQLREALYRLFTAVRTADVPQASDVALVNGWAVRAVPGVGLRLDKDRVRTVAVPADVAVLMTQLARDGVDLITGPEAGRIRECARADCALLFVDTSRAGVRRWCATQACGARSRMSAYRRRQTGMGA